MRKFLSFVTVLTGIILFFVACVPPPGQGSPPGQSEPPGQNRNNGNSSSIKNQGVVSTANGNNFSDNVTVSFTDKYMIVESNGVPDHESGPFPNMTDSNRDGRPDNPNRIQPQKYRFKIPLNPQLASSTTPVPMGPIGVSLSGIPFYNAWTAESTYAVQTEAFDKCQGHPDRPGRYHYHQVTNCIDANMQGYAFDGFEIRGKTELDGQAVTGLDECNGHEHDGSYHYHATDDPSKPLIGCYMGVVETSNLDFRR